MSERYMVAAKTVTKGTHTGYVTTSPDGTLCLEWREYGLNPDNPRIPQTVKNYIYPETIVPVAAEVKVGENGNMYCPNCKTKVGYLRGKRYCADCGQALSWKGGAE